MGGNKLRLVAEFAETDTKTIGTLYSIDQSKEPIAMQSVSVKNDVLIFKIPALDYFITIESRAFSNFSLKKSQRISFLSTFIRIISSFEFTIVGASKFSSGL